MRRRRDWVESQPDLDASRLVFIDETGLSTKMARLRGRALRGERCRAGVPQGHWKTTTFTGALRLSGMTAPCVYDGAMNGAVFRAYVEQVLAPTLKPADIVIMDNLSAHKRLVCARRSSERGRRCCSCRPTVRTSIRSRMRSPNSRRSCAPEPSERSTAYGAPSGHSLTASHLPNVQTTSKPPVIVSEKVYAVFRVQRYSRDWIGIGPKNGSNFRSDAVGTKNGPMCMRLGRAT